VKVLDAEFVGSAARPSSVPEDGLPHVVMVGRSNVGKSTLINALTRSRLARTAAKPGKTRLINLYRVNLAGAGRLDLVDLPGYGHASGGTGDFDAMMAEYFAWRRTHDRATLILLLVDGRHPGLDRDRVGWSWMVEQGLPAMVVVTKIDKLSRAERARHLKEFADTFNVPLVAVSATKGEGLEALWTTIARQLLPK
jgi:GTP-binding protein